MGVALQGQALGCHSESWWRDPQTACCSLGTPLVSQGRSYIDFLNSSISGGVVLVNTWVQVFGREDSYSTAAYVFSWQKMCGRAHMKDSYNSILLLLISISQFDWVHLHSHRHQPILLHSHRHQPIVLHSHCSKCYFWRFGVSDEFYHKLSQVHPELLCSYQVKRVHSSVTTEVELEALPLPHLGAVRPFTQ